MFCYHLRKLWGLRGVLLHSKAFASKTVDEIKAAIEMVSEPYNLKGTQE